MDDSIDSWTALEKVSTAFDTIRISSYYYIKEKEGL